MKNAFSRLNRRSMLGALSAVPVLSYAQDGKTVKMLVPAAPGSSTDLTARIMAEGLRLETNQIFVIENKAGASGAIGSEALAKAPPDGFTIGFMTVGALAINQALYAKLRYDAANDFTPIAFGGHTPSLLVVQESSPYRSVADIISAARKAPGRLNFASAGNGTTSHIAGEVIKAQGKVDMQHVPFKSNDGLKALLSGVVDFTFYHPISVAPQIKEGRLRALAVSSKTRFAGFPNVPTMIEQGFEGFDLTAWYAFMGPKGMTEATIRQYAAAIRRVFDQPTVAAQLAAQGVEIEMREGPALEAFLNEERRKWTRLVKLSGSTLG